MNELWWIIPAAALLILVCYSMVLRGKAEDRIHEQLYGNKNGSPSASGTERVLRKDPNLSPDPAITSDKTERRDRA